MAEKHLDLKENVMAALMTVETPALVIDRELIKARYREFRTEFGSAAVYYALKANPHPGIVGLLQGIGCEFEISSQGELDSLLRLGVPVQNIISSNPVKEPSFISSAYASGIDVFAFDSQDEVEKLSRLASGSKVYVRLSVPNEGSEWPLSRKFGVETEDAARLLLEAERKGLRPWGIAFHVGSQCTLPGTWAKAIEKSKAVWALAADKGIQLRALNVGGGFPIRYTRPVPSIAEVARVVRQSLSESFPADVDIIVAPGRALVGDAGTLVATVVSKAERDTERWLYLDVGVFNGLMEAVGGMKYAMLTDRATQARSWVLAGPSCDSFDVVSTEVQLPEMETGDRVYILGAGAYTTAYASEFDGFPIPQTHFVG